MEVEKHYCTPYYSLFIGYCTDSCVLDRLESTGYRTVALTHTVYGRPHVPQDESAEVLPVNITRSSNRNVLCRLHRMVIENLSDLGFYTTPSSATQSIFADYNLVKVSPCNNATFQQACATATAAEIITLLEYTVRGRLFFFWIRSADVQAAAARCAVFAIPYTKAILCKNHSKTLIHVCQELQAASLGTEVNAIPRLGARIYQERDVGALALRAPEDLVHLAKTVLSFDDRTSSRFCGAAGHFVVEQGERRCFPGAAVVDVFIDDGSMKQPSRTREFR
jgi:hypothetical protein